MLILGFMFFLRNLATLISTSLQLNSDHISTCLRYKMLCCFPLEEYI